MLKALGNLFGKGTDLATGADIGRQGFDVQDVQVDQGVNPIMEGQRNRANMSEAEVQAGMLQGVEQPMQQMGAQTGPGSLALNNKDLSNALAKRSQKGFESDYARIKRRTEPQAAIQRAKNIDAARQSMEQQRNLDLQNYERRMQAYSAQESIRAQVMGNLFGAIGGFAGGALGGAGAKRSAATPNSTGGQYEPQYNSGNDGFRSGGGYAK